MFVALALPATAPASAACALSDATVRWIQMALDGWARVSVEALEIDPEPLPWLVLFDRSCAWHLEPDDALLSDAGPAAAGLTFAGEPVSVQAVRHDGAVRLPTGATIPAGPAAFTAVYEREPGERVPFVALALPDLWREAAPADADAALDARFEAITLGIAVHEIVHTRQVVHAARRIDELRRRHTLPERLGDRMVEERFRDVPGFRDAHDAETDLLYRAVGEPDRERRLVLVADALDRIRARQARFFTGPEAIYRELEELFLNMEGVAVWAAYELARRHPAYGMEPDDDPAVERARNTWAQDQGLALMLLIDELVPEWRERMLGPELASPYRLLEEAVGRALDEPQALRKGRLPLVDHHREAGRDQGSGATVRTRRRSRCSSSPASPTRSSWSRSTPSYWFRWRSRRRLGRAARTWEQSTQRFSRGSLGSSGGAAEK